MNKISYNLFVKHPPEMDKESLEALLRQCGPLEMWKPQIDPSTNLPKNFGFAHYKDMQTLERAVRLLPSLPLDPWLAKIDVKTARLLDQHSKSNPPIDHSSADNPIRTKIYEIIKPFIKKSSQTEPSTDKAEAFLDSILPSSNLSKDFSNNSLELKQFVPEGSYEEISDEEELRKREEKRKSESDRAYKERLRAWESRENYRAKLRKEAKDREIDIEERVRFNKEELPKILAQYDDDLEREFADDLWYSNRDAWIDKRKIVREKEFDMDKRIRENDGSFSNRSIVSKSDSNSKEKFSIGEFKKEMNKLLKSTLSFLDPIKTKRDNIEQLFSFPLQWNLITPSSIKLRIMPIIENRITQFLGENDQDLVDFIAETILPPFLLQESDSQDVDPIDRDPHSILEEISNAFGESKEEKEEAANLLIDVWKGLIWENEKQRVLNGKKIIGLDAEIESLNINECLL